MDLEEKVGQLRDLGYGNKQIAEITGIDLANVTSTIERLIRKDATKRLRRQRNSKQEVEQLQKMIIQLRSDPRNLSHRQIAEIIGEREYIIGNYINKLIAEGRIPRKTGGRPKSI